LERLGREVEEIKRDLEDILFRGNGRKLDEDAEKLGMLLSKKATVTQVRNIFDRVRRTVYSENDVALLKSKFYYMAARYKGLEPLKEVFSEAIDLILEKGGEEQFRQLKSFFEAVVAYQRYYEERKGGR